MRIEEMKPADPVDVEDIEDDDTPENVLDATTPGSVKKKKKKPKKKTGTEAAVDPNVGKTVTVAESPKHANAATAVEGGSVSMTALQSLVARLGSMGMLTDKETNSKEEKGWSMYKFWSTQPVTRTDETVVEDGVIETKTVADIQKEPYPLKDGFEWSMIDITQEARFFNAIKEVYELLTLNYVEDDDAMFRFDYSAEFLKWALQPPGWKKVWHLGVRVTSNKKLVAFISGIPADMNVHEKKIKLVEINFLCVHKKLRSKRLAPILIKEITRLVNLEGIFQAVYTAGAYLPKPFSTCRYYHRSLHPKKLIETGFSSLSSKTTMAATIRRYKLPEAPLIPGTRAMEARDVPAYLSRFEVAPHFSEAEVKHWLLPLKTDPETKTITDFYSFYSLPSSVIGNPKHTHIKAAYLFYFAPKGMGGDTKRLQDLMKDALILAKKNDFDVFNCLNLKDNQVFLDELKFGRGDGNLNYYLYNYRCTDIKPEKLGLCFCSFGGFLIGWRAWIL
ncbi:Myristoyl-CoA:protein N-myristoyltransferase, N-terminal domain-containing protein [Chytridium lagenaria]|nr:Myristoyl-CoA:protein N-myristoyltransferase, N-terminal domain-containing protein [Chytridium lagenaria]